MALSLPPQLVSLLRPQSYPHAVAAVDLVETHISWVFLTGEFAYKIKKPVCYPFIDLRSPERRAFFCAEELRLNRRFAPGLYLDVCAVTLDNGTARISGRGEVFDHAVRMRQFRREDELGCLLARGALAPRELAVFGHELAITHAQLPLAGAGEPWGRPESVRTLLLQNLAQCLRAAEELGLPDAVRSLSELYGARLAAAQPWLAERRATGRVRECHGDLYAGNIVFYGNHLLAFDCMEFEPAFRWIDVAEEIAFLFMDLRARHFAAYGQVFLNGYLFQSGDYQACRLLRLYASHRALVRAKVAALQVVAPIPEDVRATRREAHSRYIACAREMLATDRPLLILICGVSGSGKTWLAERLAPELDAVHVRSDVERKRIAGLAEQQPSGAALERGLYSAQMSEQVYERLHTCATEILAGGFSVIVDATFQRRAERARFGALAAKCRVPVHVVFCHAPREVLEARIAARQRVGADASEANHTVLALQQARFEQIRSAENLRVIDADTTRVDVVARVSALIQQPTA